MSNDFHAEIILRLGDLKLEEMNFQSAIESYIQARTLKTKLETQTSSTHNWHVYLDIRLAYCLSKLNKQKLALDILLVHVKLADGNR